MANNRMSADSSSLGRELPDQEEHPEQSEPLLPNNTSHSQQSSRIDYSQQDLILSYSKAIKRTTGNGQETGPEARSPFRRHLFQISSLFISIMALNSCNFLILGLPFMKSEPHHFKCREHGRGEWHSCTKHEICSQGLSKSEYIPDESDSQYIDNWQEQTNMLCESKQRIGFLGASFFIGVLVASTVVPVGYLSDVFGRKWIFVITLLLLAVACLGLLMAQSVDELYVYMFLLGVTFPGRIIVGMNYAYEFQTSRWKEYVQPLNQLTQGVTLILTAFYFQFISKKVFYLELVHFLFVVFIIAQTLAMFPESPRYNYSKDEFHKAKESLELVARINGTDKFNKHNFKFDTEKELEDIQNQGEVAEDQKIQRKDGGNEFGISDSDFYKNLALMCLLFTCFSFSFWLADF